MTIQTHTLSNGFQIVTEHMPGLKSASVGIWVDVGGRHERLSQNGIAHFLEHMAFKGTPTRTALQIAEAIEDVGGFINAYTSRENTAYYARVLEDDVPLATEVIADILMNPVFDQADVDIERGVILQEIGMTNDTPDDIVFDWLQEVAYPDQALGRTILGPSEKVSGFQPDDLRGFVAEHYGPGQMVLAAAGAVDHDAICRQAEALFGGMSPIVRPDSLIEPAAFKGGEFRRDKDLEQVHFALAFEGPNYRDPEIYTAQIYASVMGGGVSSRLFQEVREKRGLTYGIRSYLVPKFHAETWIGQVASSNDTIAEAIAVTRDVWADLATNGITAEELAVTKTFLTGEYPLRFDGNAEIAGIMVGMQMIGLSPDYVVNRNDFMNAVTLADVNGVAAEYLRPDDLHFVVVGQPVGLESTN